jgi:hypothetical protein
LAAQLVAAPSWACYAVIVGRLASADGSVLVGHNEQNGGQRLANLRKIPRRQLAAGATVPLQRGGALAQVALLVDGQRSAAVHNEVWDGRDGRGRAAASGVYVAELRAAGVVRTTKVLLLR